MTGDKNAPVWPLDDDYFEGDAVHVMLDRFGDVIGEAVGLHSVIRIAELLAQMTDGEDTSLIMSDAIYGAQSLLRAISRQGDNADIAGASFYFGAAFALASLEDRGIFASAGHTAWVREKQSTGAKERPKPKWHALALEHARGLWTHAPGRSPADVAEETLAWLKTEEPWSGLRRDPPATVETVRRFLARNGLPLRNGREVHDARREVPDT